MYVKQCRQRLLAAVSFKSIPFILKLNSPVTAATRACIAELSERDFARSDAVEDAC